MTFRIISEGITDQVVLKNLMHGYFNNSDLDISELYPKDRINPYGWPKVFEYCKSDEFKEAFNWIDYTIIHIDSDTKNDWGYNNIPDSINGNEESVINQIIAIIEVFKGVIGIDFYNENQDKIIFAIAIQTTECWILPFYSSQKAHQSKIVNCLSTLNPELNRKFGFTIDPKKKAADNLKFYHKAAVTLRNQKAFRQHYKKNPSLKYFVEQLDLKFG